MYCALSIQTSCYQPSTLLGSTSCRHYLFTLFLLSTTQRHFCSTLPTGAALCSSLLPLRTSHGCICVLPTHRRPPLCISLTLFRFVFPSFLAETSCYRCLAGAMCRTTFMLCAPRLHWSRVCQRWPTQCSSSSWACLRQMDKQPLHTCAGQSFVKSTAGTAPWNHASSVHEHTVISSQGDQTCRPADLLT